MADGNHDDSAVLSDVDDDDAAASINPPPITTTSSSADRRLRDLLSQLDQEHRSRLAAEETLARRDESLSRLKAFAQDVIKKRDEAVREKDEALRSADAAAAKLEAAINEKTEISNQKDVLKSEMEKAAQMMVTGIDKISGKVSNFNNFAAGGLPRSQKYATGLPAVAYGVIRRANEIVEELLKQIEGASKSRDQAREQIEQRNYEIAIEVSQLEATIGGLREEVSKKGGEIERLEKMVGQRDIRISEMEKEVLELRHFGEERDGRLRSLEAKVDSQRPLVIDQLSNVFKTHEMVREIARIADGGEVAESSDFSFVWEEVDMDENLRALSEGTIAVYEMAKVVAEKVRGGLEERRKEIDGLRVKVDGLLAEKQHIGTLLRSALQSKTSEVLQVAEDGLREAGIDLRFNGQGKSVVKEGEEDEVYTLVNTFLLFVYIEF